jgi:hypothetical protein
MQPGGFGMLNRLIRDERGATILMFTIMLPVILGMIGLGLEGGRVLLLNSQLQDMADAAALAGARELDGSADARARARQAALDWSLRNVPWWSNIPVAGSQIIDPLITDVLDGPASQSDATATYIKVTTLSRSIAPAFLAAVGVTTFGSTSATATAGSTYVVCDVQPLMLCNPNEPAAFTATAGNLYGFTQQGGGAGLSPGDFALLDPAGQTNSGATAIRNLLSQSRPNFCYANNVSPRPGQAASSVADGINVRFDMQPQGNNQIAGLDRTPAPNVIKGLLPQGNCNWNNPTAIPNGNLPGASNATQQGHLWIGTSTDMAAANAYWQYHHGADWPATLTTRYAAYQLERGQTGTAPAFVNVPPRENPAPVCAPASVRNSGDDRRRILSVAIVDCVTQGVQGNSVTNVRSNKYADFFLIKPVGQDGVIWAEFMGMITPQTPGPHTVHHIVELVRDQ